MPHPLSTGRSTDRVRDDDRRRPALHDDDRTIGCILDRRQILKLFGAGGAALLVGCGGGGTTSDTTTSDGTTSDGTTSGGTTGGGGGGCVVSPAETEGPFFVDELLNRSDIRSDPLSGLLRTGLPFGLGLTISKIVGSVCTPISGAQVDLWHCDAAGKYSDESSEGTLGQKWLRGYQTTDANGQVQFTTIYPGWYSGRTTHMHFKVRTGAQTFTSQLFFDEAVTSAVYAQSPYSAKGAKNTSNAADGIFQTGGSSLMLALAQVGASYNGTFAVAFA